MRNQIQQLKEKLGAIFQADNQLGILYLFGSQLDGDIHAGSDFDFGVFSLESDPLQRFYHGLRVQDTIEKVLPNDKIDVKILNDITTTELQFQIIQGEVLFERESYRILIEPKIRMHHEDFMYGLKKYGLTKAI
ncbi:MAG: Uncharacterized protein G01um101418_580 [Parcubacteria group bacterium Gr01-1014_18]|nr:MAG: Uncharacterized protein Greene041636_129 [Parcubacteria group bacterium Greene0416_36]TSC80832.1 MAG: Uncharacterized protein G01um101418_580 [Parcubacteria group bacterium Gr01-1014_18]TSC99493.1 MAG: Uncharacterized protein Greene101420_160 [Parcubacteria group bacterium Greene1014_20]TSD07588.1 MAG: Uncharacterized protein Greene07142_45 [Parcubacteria group bacterium Greene0714_2]